MTRFDYQFGFANFINHDIHVFSGDIVKATLPFVQ